MFYRISKLCELTGLQRHSVYNLIENTAVEKIIENGRVGTNELGLTVLSNYAKELSDKRESNQKRKSQKLQAYDILYTTNGDKRKVIEITDIDVVLYNSDTRGIIVIPKQELEQMIADGTYLLKFEKGYKKAERKITERNYYVYSKCGQLYGTITAPTNEKAVELAKELYGDAWSNVTHVKSNGSLGKRILNKIKGDKDENKN